MNLHSLNFMHNSIKLETLFYSQWEQLHHQTAWVKNFEGSMIENFILLTSLEKIAHKFTIVAHRNKIKWHHVILSLS